MNSWGWDSYVWREHICHYIKYALSSILSIYITLIDIVLRDSNVFICHNWFLFYMGLHICKYEPYWQEVSVDYLILRWPFRPVGLLFYYLSCDKIILLVSRYLSLWPWPCLELAIIGGISFHKHLLFNDLFHLICRKMSWWWYVFSSYIYNPVVSFA